MHRPGGPPPPLLMHIGAVGRVHQADDGMVDMGVEIHRLDHLRIAPDDAGKQGRLVVRIGRVTWIGGHPDKDHPLAFTDGIGPHPDAIRLIGLVLDQGGDGGADPVRAEPPAVVAALDGLALARFFDQSSGGQGRRAVRADVAHRIDLTRAGPADQHRLAQQFVAFERGRGDIARQGDEIPGVQHKPGAEGGRRGLGFGGTGGEGGAVGWAHANTLAGRDGEVLTGCIQSRPV